MKPFERGKIGYDDGCRVKIISRRKWGEQYVYRLRVFSGKQGSKQWWIEYKSHWQLNKDRTFWFNRAGDYCGREQ